MALIFNAKKLAAAGFEITTEDDNFIIFRSGSSQAQFKEVCDIVEEDRQISRKDAERITERFFDELERQEIFNIGQ